MSFNPRLFGALPNDRSPEPRLPTAARVALEALVAFDGEAFTKQLAPDAVLCAWGRVVLGRAAIHRWVDENLLRNQGVQSVVFSQLGTDQAFRCRIPRGVDTVPVTFRVFADSTGVHIFTITD